EALGTLGTEAGLIVSGEEGLDEVSGAGPTVAISVGRLSMPSRLAPEDAGLLRHPIAAIHGGDPAYNAAALRRLLQGERGAYRDAVLINAAAALMVAGRADSLSEAAEEAAETIDKGLANALLDCWIAYK
ncbi:MAG: anthranilate phosphoribosyltransferase, partial [Proteobacteria bacterium]|nr:anthranilate phosphoribosyltransferase [Pseudomonadota bacterium]